MSFIVHGSSFSAAFDAHGARSGQLPGLRRGWLFGRSVVGIVLNAALPKSAHSSQQWTSVVSPDHTALRSESVDRVQDLSDIQWRQFREGLPLAAAAMAAFAAASRAVRTPPQATLMIDH